MGNEPPVCGMGAAGPCAVPPPVPFAACVALGFGVGAMGASVGSLTAVGAWATTPSGVAASVVGAAGAGVSGAGGVVGTTASVGISVALGSVGAVAVASGSVVGWLTGVSFGDVAWATCAT